MPIECSEKTFPSGETYLYVLSSGRLTVPEVDTFLAQLDRPEYGGRAKVLTLTATGTSYPLDVRRHFMSVSFNFGAMANVVTSPIVRASINMLLRLAPNRSNYKLFDDESAALAWLAQYERA